MQTAGDVKVPESPMLETDPKAGFILVIEYHQHLHRHHLKQPGGRRFTVSSALLFVL